MRDPCGDERKQAKHTEEFGQSEDPDPLRTSSKSDEIEREETNHVPDKTPFSHVVHRDIVAIINVLAILESNNSVKIEDHFDKKNYFE